MNAVNLFLVLAVYAIVADGHMCMWSPVQREGAAISAPGQDLCYRKEGPCGGVTSGEPVTTLIGGKDFSILFQQNLNHYYVDNPGKFVADFARKADPAESDFTPLGQPISDYNAMNEMTATNFTIKVVVPNVDCEHCVVRLRYESQNPMEEDQGTTFHQCADVRVKKSATQNAADFTTKPVTIESSSKNSTLSECCAAQQFTLEGYETGSWRKPTSKKIYFDAVNRFLRIDTISGSGKTALDGHFQIYSNYSSGAELYYNVNDDSCDVHGLNYWSDWCYGSINKQSLLQSVTVGNGHADVWEQTDTPFLWSNMQNTCVPVSFTRKDTGEATYFYNFKSGAPDLNLHVPPQTCLDALAKVGDVKALKPAPVHLRVF